MKPRVVKPKVINEPCLEHRYQATYRRRRCIGGLVHKVAQSIEQAFVVRLVFWKAVVVGFTHLPLFEREVGRYGPEEIAETAFDANRGMAILQGRRSTVHEVDEPAVLVVDGWVADAKLRLPGNHRHGAQPYLTGRQSHRLPAESR